MNQQQGVCRITGEKCIHPFTLSSGLTLYPGDKCEVLGWSDTSISMRWRAAIYLGPGDEEPIWGLFKIRGVEEVREADGKKYPVRELRSDYLNFGDFCRNVLGTQCQYGSYFLLGLAGHPNFSQGIRIIGDPSRNYHSVRIHKGDAEVLKGRVEAWRRTYE